MANLSDEKLVLTLKEIGYEIPSNVSLRWMMDNESTKELFQWFCENINSSNYLSEDELKEYGEIELSGNVLKGDELDKEIEKFMPDYEEFYGKEVEYLSELRSELAEEQSYSTTLKDLENKLRGEISAVNFEIKDLEEKNNSLQTKIVKAQEDCLGRNSELESAIVVLKGNIEKVVKYSNQFGQGNRDLLLIAEFPIEPYKDEITLFECRIQNRFDELNLLKNKHQRKSNLHSMEEWDLELAKLRKGYASTRLLWIKEESERRGLESSCDFVKEILNGDNLLILASNPAVVREMLLETKQKIQNIEQELGDLRSHGTGDDNIGSKYPSSWEGWWSKTKNAVNELSCHKMNDIECVQREVVITERNLQIKALKGIIEDFKAQCATDLTWMMFLGNEVTKMSNISEKIVSAADYIKAEQNDRFHRIELMKKYKEYDINRIELWPLLNSLFYHTQHSQLGEESRSSFFSSSSLHVTSSFVVINSAIQILAKNSDNLNVEMSILEDSVIDQINQHFSLLESRWKDMSQLWRKIFSGSTSTQAVLCPLEPIKFAHHYREKVEKFMTKLKTLKKNYMSNKKRVNPEGKILRTLWILFLTNPNELQGMVSEDKENVDINE